MQLQASVPNNRDFGHIELSRKKDTAHLDWEQVVIQARQENPFHVRKKKKEDSSSAESTYRSRVV